MTETAPGGTARLEVRNDRSLTNPLNRFDADRDGRILPLDALRIINELRRRGAGAFTLPTNDGEISRLYFDVSGDNFLTALDALRIINALARIARGGQPEGEASEVLAGLDQSSRSVKFKDDVLPPDAFMESKSCKISDGAPAVMNASDNEYLVDLLLSQYGDDEEDNDAFSRLELLSMTR